MLSMPRIVRPDPLRIRGRNLVPPLDWLLGRSIKRNKELVETSD